MNLFIILCIIGAGVSTQAAEYNPQEAIVDTHTNLNHQIYVFLRFATELTLSFNMKLMGIEANATRAIKEAVDVVTLAPLVGSENKYCHQSEREYLQNQRTHILQELNQCVTDHRSSVKPVELKLQNLLERYLGLFLKLNDSVIECISDNQSATNGCVKRNLDDISGYMNRYNDEAELLQASGIFAAYSAEQETLRCIEELQDQVNDAVEFAKKFLQICLAA